MKKIISMILIGVLTLGTGSIVVANNMYKEKKASNVIASVKKDTETAKPEMEIETEVTTVSKSEEVIVEEVAAAPEVNTNVFVCEVEGCTQNTQHTHTVCGVENCVTMDTHEHDGIWYYGHYDGDSHIHSGICGVEGCSQISNHSHALCSVSGCDITYTHDHSGTLYYGHHAEDGHGHGNSSYCNVAGCTQTGNHSHNSSGNGNGRGHHRGGHH